MANLFPYATAPFAALNSPGSCTFNNGICEARFSALGDSPTVSGDLCFIHSSAVEGVTSVVRMHQGRPRQVSQGMLDLKRLDWNCRVFEGGKRKGRGPYERLGLKLPTSEWWELLQMDPQELEQKRLTQ